METKLLSVGLNEIIDLNFEGFLDLIEELWLADLDEKIRYDYVLNNISYKPVGALEGMIQLEVSAEQVLM